MGNVRTLETGYLFFDFYFEKVRCREYTKLKDSKSNRQKMKKVMDKIDAEIVLGTFNYQAYFPNSRLAKQFSGELPDETKGPLCKDFAWEWFNEMDVGWRESHSKVVRCTVKTHVLPYFGEKRVSDITKSDILKFRTKLAKVPGRNNKEGLSAKRINQIMLIVRMIVNEAADRFDFTTPYYGIKPLKTFRSDIEPFTLDC